MAGVRKLAWISSFLMLTTLSAGNTVFAQMRPGTQPPTQPSPTEKEGAPDVSQPSQTVQQPSKQEKKAYKAFHDAQNNDQKTQLGEEFIEKYPQSQYRSEVVIFLAGRYMASQQVDKLQASGDKELEQKPANPATLAVLGSNLSRVVTPATPDAQKHLDKAAEYCQKSLDTLATAQKPSNLSEDKFEQAKNEYSSVDYSGLATVAFREQKYDEAIKDFEQAIKLGGGSDPVNYYLLGKSNEAKTNYDQALAAYTKCAAVPGGMQGPCQTSANDMKSHGAALPK
jgi:tetratricopeptide (TPR) repeat protein